MQVAVKRIPDVLSSPEQVKRVLREVCILRRLSHPFIISLLDAFVKPAAQGALPALRAHLALPDGAAVEGTGVACCPRSLPVRLAWPGGGTGVPEHAMMPAC